MWDNLAQGKPDSKMDQGTAYSEHGGLAQHQTLVLGELSGPVPILT